MDADTQFYLVDPKVLPEVFHKVMEAKYLLKGGQAKTSSEACKLAGISRSVFYKYKDHVFMYQDNTGKQIFTLGLTLNDQPGVLSSVLTKLYENHANLLTVNQKIPNETVANVTVSVILNDDNVKINDLLCAISSLQGVIDVKKI